MRTNDILKIGKIFLLSAMLGFISCDIEEINPSAVGMDKVASDYEKATNLLIGCYDALQQPYMYGGGQSTNGFRDHDGITDMAFNNWATGLSEMANGAHDANHAMVRGFWKANYTGISRCNLLLATYKDAEFEKKEQYEAEAKFLRALFYFNLTNYYGNVPFITEPIEREDAYYVINTKRTKILDEITEDLEEAVLSLPYKHELNADEYYRATKGAALGLLTRIYLFRASRLDSGNMDSWVWEDLVGEPTNDGDAQKFYGLAKDRAARLMSGEFQYDLNPVYDNLFNGTNENGVESLFEVQFETGVGEGEGFSGTYKNPQPWLVPTIEFIANFERKDGSSITTETDAEVLLKDMDPRYYTTVLMTGQMWLGEKWTGTGINYGIDPYTKYATKKYVRNQQGFFADGDRNFNVIRFADILLMFAEAKIKLGEIDTEMFDAVDRVRKRVNMPCWDRNDTDPYSLFLKLQAERMREFGLEGMRYQDMIRWGIYSEVAMRAPSAKYNDVFDYKRYVWPVPQVECDNNRSEEGLQNPQWR